MIALGYCGGELVGFCEVLVADKPEGESDSRCLADETTVAALAGR